jgi:hypothetical protein
MVPHHVELEIVVKLIHEMLLREAEAARQLAAVSETLSRAQRSPSLRGMVSGGKRVRWWFWSRVASQAAPIARSPHTDVEKREASAPLVTVSASGAMLPADPYQALVVIARGNRQRHERLVPQGT